MIWSLAIAVAAVTAAGAYLALSRDLFRAVVGLSLLGAAVNLIVLASGRIASQAPPVVPPGASTLEGAANPVPQALVLTAIVIGFALTCFALVLAVRIVRETGSDDALALRAGEPEATDPLLPALEEPAP